MFFLIIIQFYEFIQVCTGLEQNLYTILKKLDTKQYLMMVLNRRERLAKLELPKLMTKQKDD